CTVYPNGANSRLSRSGGEVPSSRSAAEPPPPPPRAGTTASVAVSGRGVVTSSGRSLLRPFMAVENSLLIATLRKLEATYGRSLTYWSSVHEPQLDAPRPPPPCPPPLPRTRPTGSTSSSTAARQRPASSTGWN